MYSACAPYSTIEGGCIPLNSGYPMCGYLECIMSIKGANLPPVRLVCFNVTCKYIYA